MPRLLLESAPKSRPSRTVMAIATGTAASGVQPRLSPFVFPFVVRLPIAKPAIP